MNCSAAGNVADGIDAAVRASACAGIDPDAVAGRCGCGRPRARDPRHWAPARRRQADASRSGRSSPSSPTRVTAMPFAFGGDRGHAGARLRRDDAVGGEAPQGDVDEFAVVPAEKLGHLDHGDRRRRAGDRPGPVQARSAPPPMTIRWAGAGIELEDRLVGEIRNGVEAGNRRHAAGAIRLRR